MVGAISQGLSARPLRLRNSEDEYQPSMCHAEKVKDVAVEEGRAPLYGFLLANYKAACGTSRHGQRVKIKVQKWAPKMSHLIGGDDLAETALTVH